MSSKRAASVESSVNHIDALHSFIWCFFFLNLYTKALDYFPAKYWNICENVGFLVKQMGRFWVEIIRHALPAATLKAKMSRWDIQDSSHMHAKDEKRSKSEV